MTVTKELCKYFELFLFELRHSRMYPPGYRKESTMRNLTLDHVDAISHAETYIHPAIVPNMPPHHRKSIEDDLARLAEIKRSILKAMYEPGLPLSTEIPEELPKHGDTSRTS